MAGRRPGGFFARLALPWVCTAIAALWLSGCTQSIFSGDMFSYSGKYFTIERPDVTSIDTYEIEQEERTTPFTDRSQRTDTLNSELKIRTNGWVYHPALATYSAELRPKIKTQTIKEEGAAEQEDDITFFGFSVDTTFLQYKPYTVKLTSSRDQSDFSSTLSPDTTTESAFDRAQLLLKYDPVPTTFTVQRRSTETEGFFTTRNDTALARIESRHQTDQSDSFAKAELIHEEREIQNSQSTVDRARATARNAYRFNEALRLSSSVSASQSESEDRDSTNLSLSEGLRWKHAENLRSRYNIRLQRRTEDDFFTNSATGSAGLTHRLYENLSTSANVNAGTNEFSDGSIRNYGGNLNFDYQRRIPWGNISVNNGYGYRIEDDRTESALTQILDESLTLTGTNTVFLASDNVEAGSIVVTDAAGLVTFVPNVDYVVRVIGNTIGIERLIFGGIGDGDTVLVDYTFTPDPPHKTDEKTVNFGVNLSLFDSLNLFYNVAHTEESLLSGTAPSELADDTVHRAGARFKYEWSTTSVEYEQRDTTRNPLNKLIAREVVAFRPFRELSLGGAVSYTETEFTDTGDTNTNLQGNANVHWQPVTWGGLEARGFVGRVRGDTQRIDREGATALFSWRYGLWRGSVRAEYLREEDIFNTQVRENTSVLFRVERKLWE